LVFVGAGDVADYYRCAVKSILQNRRMELGFFRAYLEDRVRASVELGYSAEPPKDPEELLVLASKLRFEDAEELLRKKSSRSREGTGVELIAVEVKGGDGRRAMVLNPDIPKDELEPFVDPNAEVIEAELFPELRGEMLQSTRVERYPTIRWHFPWKNFVVVGTPDGITERYVYEFKTTRNSFLEHFVRPVAFAQADLYGYFFQRYEKRVQIYVINDGRVDTWQEGVRKENALDLLYKFTRLAEGEEPVPPKRWKCESCEYKAECTLSRGFLASA
jgi:CRISPR/Cas system-associated exonuclease Cas4 (RecB family)